MNNLTAAIIGAGRVGTNFAKAFRKSKIKVKCIIDKNIKTAKSLAQKLKCNLYSNNILSIPDDVDLILISVEDRFISEVVERLTKSKIDFKKKYIFHTSGSLTSDILSPIKNLGAKTFSLHPNISFANKEELIDFTNIVCAIESDTRKTVRFAKKLCNKLGCKSITISKEEKALYHSFAVMISNYTVLLFKEINDYFPDRKVLSSFVQLLKSTMNNIVLYGPNNSLTGPIARGDYETIRRNISSLNSIDNDLVEVYKKLGALIIKNFKLNHNKETRSKLISLFEEHF